MPAKISLLVFSLVFSSLVFNCQAKVNGSFQTLPSQYQAQVSKLDSPMLHRGSGRLNLMPNVGGNA